MKTPDEARQCWCPFSRYSVEERAWKRAINRWIGVSDVQLNPEPARCIAEECMAWRWGNDHVDTRDGSAAVERKTYPVGVLQERGFCGLAGKL